MLKVRNMTSPKTGKEIANQFVITDDERNVDLFQSYQSPIVEIDRNNLTITVHSDYDYSNTTRKYRNKFMMEQGFSELAVAKEFKKYLEIGTYDIFTIVKAF